MNTLQTLLSISLLSLLSLLSLSSCKSSEKRSVQTSEPKTPAAEPSKEFLLRLRAMEIDEEMSKTASLPDLHKYVLDEYEAFVKYTYRNYNDIRVSLVKKKGSAYGLWARHPFFSEYSFQIGDEADLFRDWAIIHHDSLKKAKVIEFGVAGSSGKSGFRITN